MLDEKLQMYTERMERAWEDVENVLVQSGACEKNPERTEGSSQKSWISSLKNFVLLHKITKSPWNRNTQKSQKALDNHETYMNKCFSIVKRTSSEIKGTIFNLWKPCHMCQQNVVPEDLGL